MTVLLISFLLLLYTFQSLLCRKYSEHYPGAAAMSSPVFSMVSGLVVAVITFAFSAFSFTPSPMTVLLGICNAVALFLYNTFMILASKNGPYSVLMTFMLAGGILVPAAVNFFAFSVPLSLIQILAIVVIVLAIYIVSYKEGEGRGNLLFYIACFGLFFCNGIYCSLLNAQQELAGEGERGEMIMITYFGTFALSAIVALAQNARGFVGAFRQTRRSLFYLLSCSVVVALAVNLVVDILTRINPTILFTIDHAGVLLLSVLISHFFLHEKLSRLNWVGCALMCAALVCFSAF